MMVILQKKFHRLEEADKLREFFAAHQDKPALENPSGVS